MTQGIFETMRAVGTGVPLFARHLARLRSSADGLGLECPDDDDLAGHIASSLAGAGPRDLNRVRLTLRPGGAVTATCSPVPDSHPIRLATVPGYDPFGSALDKLTDRSRYVRPIRTAEAAGADHPLLVSREGAVGETDHANIFVGINGRLITPPAAGILPGVARALIVERMGAAEEILPRVSLDQADEIFLTNALRGVIRVASLDSNMRAAGPIEKAATEFLLAAFQTR